MRWFTHARLATKLVLAFVACACITLVVGFLGNRGISELTATLRLTFSNNLVSVGNTNAATAFAIAQNRDLYRLFSLLVSQAPANEIAQVRQNMQANQRASEQAFATYRTTPLEDDERAAGDQMDKDWPQYQAALRSAVEAMDKGDYQHTRELLKTEVETRYRQVLGELKIMVDSNNRQVRESAEHADAVTSQASWLLYGGVLIAFVVALGLGLLITRAITVPIAQAVTCAQRIARGDLREHIHSDRRDETGRLLQALAGMQENLKDTLKDIANAADQLASAAEELSTVTEESSRGLVQQNDEIHLAATAVNQMTNAVEEVARSAVSTSEASRETTREADTGRTQVQQAVGAIDTLASELGTSSGTVQQLAEQVRGIGSVADVIRGIAEQTNLLALNAAIEAARAGEQGRGFAVVADEVRALAARTQQSTGEIEGMIQGVQQTTDQAVRAMDSSQTLAQNTQRQAQAADQALARITEAVAGINERNLVIASAAEEQAQVAREVDRNLTNIQDLSTQTAAGANQTNAASQDLSRLAVSFNQLVARFQL